MTQRRFPTHKEAGNSWLGPIPISWKVARLRYFIQSIEQGWSPQCDETPVDSAASWGVLKVGCVNHGTFNPNENKALPEDLEPIPDLSVNAGDLLVSRANTRELVGSAAVADRDYKNLMICDKLYRIFLDRRWCNPRFLAMSMATRGARDQIELGATGASASMQNISQNTLKELTLAFPPIDEQLKIVSFLDRETNKIDALIAEQERLIVLLAEKRRAVISRSVVPPMHEGHWHPTRLAWVIREVQRPVSVEPEKIYAEIGVRSHGKGVFHKEPAPGWHLEEKKVFWVEPGDLVFNIVFAWERAVAVISEEDRGRIASHRFPMYRPVNDNACDVHFLKYFFMSEMGHDLLEQNSPGAAGRNRTLDRDRLMKEIINLPPIAEQRRIVESIGSRLAAIDALQEVTQSAIALLQERRAAIISAAVTGKIDVRMNAAVPL